MGILREQYREKYVLKIGDKFAYSRTIDLRDWFGLQLLQTQIFTVGYFATKEWAFSPDSSLPTIKYSPLSIQEFDLNDMTEERSDKFFMKVIDGGFMYFAPSIYKILDLII